MFRCVKLWIHGLIDNSFSFFKHSIQWKGYFPRSNVFKGKFSRLSNTIYHNFGTLNPSVTKHYCLGSFRNVFPRILTPVQSLWTHNLTRLSPLDHFYPIFWTIFRHTRRIIIQKPTFDQCCPLVGPEHVEFGISTWETWMWWWSVRFMCMCHAILQLDV